jgi:hypothetical protein
MKVYTYSEARQRLADVLNIARSEEVVIKRIGDFSHINISTSRQRIANHRPCSGSPKKPAEETRLKAPSVHNA